MFKKFFMIATVTVLSVGAVGSAFFEAPVYNPDIITNEIYADELPSFTEEDINCMTDNLYHEARGEPESGQRGVVQVVLNRMKDKRWPSTVCGVIYYPSAFSWVYENPTIDDRALWEQLKLKVIVWMSEPMTWWEANHYHADYVDPYWNKDMQRLAYIGDHIFYQD